MKFTALLPVLILVGCVPPRPLDTPSGFPEVSVRATPARVRDFIAAEMLPYGWTVRVSNEYQLTVGHTETGMGASMLGGTRLAPNPEQRRTYTFLGQGEMTRVTVRAWLVSNPGTAFENLTPFGAGSVLNAEIQNSLERVKAIMER